MKRSTMPKMIDKVLGINERNVEYINPHNPRKSHKWADDKYLAKSLMERNDIACPKTYGFVKQMGEIEEIWNKVKHHESLVIKPARGMGGNGIMLLKRDGDSWLQSGKEISSDKIKMHIANTLFGSFSSRDEDTAIIEEKIEPHEFFYTIFPKGVPDLRVIVFKNEPAMAMLRMPTLSSNGKANLHQGGLAIGINIETGKCTHVYNGKRYFKHHPDTGSRISGLQIPFWEELIDLSIKVAEVFPLDYLGVDLVIDKVQGPMVMEVNVRPGLGIQMANKEGLKKTLD